MGTTIKDIAEQADVSTATVSLVLNNKPGVGAATRERVLELAQKLKYTASQRNSASSTHHGTIRFLKIARHGHTVNRDHTVFISDYIDGIVQTGKSLHYKTQVTSFHTTPIKEIVATIQSEPELSGAIVLGTELNRNDVLMFRSVSIPLVFIDTFMEYVPFDFVDMNNVDSVFMVIEHFLRYGHSKIGLVRSRVRTRNFYLRDKAFVEGMACFGIEIDKRYIFQADSTFDGAYQDMKRYLDEGVPLPTALFCTNDIIAFGTLKALREKGIAVPGEISLVGFDDLPTAALLDPPLTSIAVSKKEIGSTAMRRLHARIQNVLMPPSKIVVGGELIERESVAPLSRPKIPELRDIDSLLGL